MIDLGLPSGTKWACCNVGADKPEGYGGYYAWGETEEKRKYTYDNYKFRKKGIAASSICGTQYDVARVKWGISWQMPSREQIEELVHKCKYEWTTLNGVKGGRFTGSNGSSIFLPAAGHTCDPKLNYGDKQYVSSRGFYFSGSPKPSDTSYACEIDFKSDGASTSQWGWRCQGYSIRPVAK